MSALLILDWANVSGGVSMDGWQIDLSLLPKAVGARIGQSVSEGVVVAPWRPGGGGITGVAHHLGYDCATRPMPDHLLERRKGTRCNLDAEFTIEALRRARSHDTVVLGSADGDFLPLAHALRAEGKTVYLLGSARCASAAVRDSSGFRFLNIASMQEDTGLKPGPRNPVPFGTRPPKRAIAPGAPSDGSSLVVDLPCLASATRREGWTLDLDRLASLASEQSGAIATVDLVVRDDVELPGIASLCAARGWRFHVIPQGSAGPARKAQPDVLFTMAAVRAAQTSRNVVLATGSGEFFRLFDEIQASGRNAYLAFPDASCSHRLARLADDKFIRVTAANAGKALPHPPRSTGIDI